jgi:hypothetical protein
LVVTFNFFIKNYNPLISRNDIVATQSIII